ncbi:MAG: hypothetical protein JNL32_00625 [Candidatus Kapabacteria bacterium]|nr:hypothetical protein [Candidatus Kapabacteria bacterium]
MSVDRGNYQDRGGYNRDRGYNNDRSGDRGYNNDRGGYNRDRGFNNDRGGDRGNYQDRGGYNRDRGFNNDRGGYNRDRGNYQDRSGYNRDRGFNNDRREVRGRDGGFDQRNYRNRSHGGFDNRSRSRDPYAQRQEPPQRPTTMIKALVRLLYASRGISLEAMQTNRVTLNDIVVTEPNAPIKILKDIVKVDNVFMMHNPRNVYIVMNKPKKFAGSREDDSRNIMNLIAKKKGWYIPIGPLSKSSSGIVVLTNDPEQRHPEQNLFALMDKEYWFKVNKVLTKRNLGKLEERVEALHPDNTGNVKVDVAQKNIRNSWVSITVRNARVHDLSKLIKEAGWEILAIERKRIGSLHVDDLPTGSWRRLSDDELTVIMKDSVSMDSIEQKNVEPSNTEGESAWQRLYHRWFKST